MRVILFWKVQDYGIIKIDGGEKSSDFRQSDFLKGSIQFAYGSKYEKKENGNEGFKRRKKQ